MRTDSVQTARNPGVPFVLEWVTATPELAPFETGPQLTDPTLADAKLIASLLDLTLLNSDDTAESVDTLLDAAIFPLGQEHNVSVAGVCVYPTFLAQAGSWLHARGVKVVTVAGAFPHGLTSLDIRLAEIENCARLADEVDIATPRYLALEERWDDLYTEVQAMVRAAKGVPVKVILGTGELPDQETVYRASITAMMAGASFIKTSTGKERVNATLDAGATMCRAIKDYSQRTGHDVGLKPAGGIRSVGEARRWIELVESRLGKRWLSPDMFRIGASSLLDHLRYI